MAKLRCARQVPSYTFRLAPVHAFSYGPGGGEMLEVTGRGSKAVRMFTALNREISPGPPDVAKVIQVVGEHGVKVHI